MTRFLKSLDTEESARIVIYGAPLDVTTSFRPGTRFGPRRIRDVSEVLESFSPSLGKDLEDVGFYDAGDLDLTADAGLNATLDSMEKAFAQVYQWRRRLLVLGGEHLVTLPAVRAVRAYHPGLVVVWLDAHADLRREYNGSRLSHATVARLVLEEIGEENLIQLGVRSVAREEADLAFRPGCHRDQVLEPLLGLKDRLKGRPIYLSIDIDVLDPAYAPGTGAPEPGGIDSRELLAAIHAFAGLELVGADIVEVAPAYDHSELTAIMAAKLCREILLLMA